MNDKQALFELNGEMPPFKYAFPMALQHLVAMIVGCVTPSIIISNMAHLSPEQSVLLIQTSLISAAFGTFLEVFLGAKLPMIMGVSFAYLASMQAIVEGFGIAEIFGAQLCGGIAAILIGFYARRIRKLFPPLITIISRESPRALAVG